MNMTEALQLVLSLAYDNMVDEDDNPEEHKRQSEALTWVQDLLDAQPKGNV